MGENLKGPVQVRDPSYSMCRKIIWQVDFQLYVFKHKLLVLLFWEAVALETDI